MKMRHAVFFVLTVGLMLAQDAAPPPAAKTTGTVEGKVVNSVTGEPVRKVSVTLQSRNSAPATTHEVQTGGNGLFFIDDVEPGEYAISALREGFIVKGPGASGAPLPPVRVEKGQALKDLIIPLAPLGVITGRVMDEDGDPIRGGQVQAMQYAYVSGKRQLRSVTQMAANDKGEFRLWGLRPGTLYIQASSRRGAMTLTLPGEPIRGRIQAGQAPTFYPNTTDAAHALPVEVTAGAQIRGIDIHLRREALYVVHGAFPPDDRLNRGGYNLQIMRRDGTGSNGMTRITNDHFEFPAVLPGSYVVRGMRMEGEKRTYANQLVEVVTENVDVGLLAFLPGVDVSGAVRIEGSAKLPPGVRVSLQPDGPIFPGSPNGEVKPDGSFVLHDVAPNIYQVNVGAGAGTYVKSVQVGDRESPDRRVDLTGGGGPLTVVLASDVGRVEGSVQNGNGEPAPRVRVTLVPQGDRSGRQELSRFGFTNEKGEFKIPNIPPGDYKIFAWEDVPAGAPQDPEFRKPFEKKGVPLKLDPNGQAKVDVPLISIAEIQHPGSATQ